MSSFLGFSLSGPKAWNVEETQDFERLRRLNNENPVSSVSTGVQAGVADYQHQPAQYRPPTPQSSVTSSVPVDLGNQHCGSGTQIRREKGNQGGEAGGAGRHGDGLRNFQRGGQNLQDNGRDINGEQIGQSYGQHQPTPVRHPTVDPQPTAYHQDYERLSRLNLNSTDTNVQVSPHEYQHLYKNPPPLPIDMVVAAPALVVPIFVPPPKPLPTQSSSRKPDQPYH